MKRCLLVTSFFPPVLSADMHRARVLAAWLPKKGWDVTVLCADDRLAPERFADPEGGRFATDACVVKARAGVFGTLAGAAGARALQLRAWPGYFTAGLSVSKKVDLVYISTAHFGLFTLGAAWKRLGGKPYVLDFHDPWVVASPRYRTHSPTWRSLLSRRLDPARERLSVTRAAGFVAVTEDYLSDLVLRYPQTAIRPREAIPFAGIEDDVRVGRELASAGSSVGSFRVAYVGAGGSIMARAFEAVCSGLRRLLEAGNPRARMVRLLLYGTEPYAAGAPALTEVARRIGVHKHVEERPQGVPYSRSLAIAAEADALLLLGVDAPAYIPSKLYTYAMFSKPMLGAFREGSPAARHFFGPPPVGEGVTFDELGAYDAEASARAWAAVLEGRVPAPPKRVSENGAERMAERHAEFFERVLA